MIFKKLTTRAFGSGILVGITIGSFFLLIRQENVPCIDRFVGVEQVSGTGTAEDATMVTSNCSGLPMGEYDGIIGNSRLEQNDPRLLNYIRKFHLIPFSTRPHDLVFAKDSNVTYPSLFLPEIRQIFRKKKNGGFFIEAGANDGEFLSNTLELERKHNWTGLLIEPNPFMLTKLLLTNRKAWIANVCLSLEGYPQKVRFMHGFRAAQRNDEIWRDGIGTIENSDSNPVPPQTQRDPQDYVYAGPVDCFPLYSLLLAINQTVIDYFSLDIEGVELRVLKSIPFHLLTIKVFSIESNLIPEGREGLTDFLKSKGYRFLFERMGVESFFVHKDFIKEFNIPYSIRKELYKLS